MRGHDRLFTLTFALVSLSNFSVFAMELSPTSPRAKAAAEALEKSGTLNVAPSPAPPSELFVKFRDASQASGTASATTGISAAAQITGANIKSILPASEDSARIVLDRKVSDQDLQTIVDSVARRPEVLYVQPEQRERIQQANDPLYSEQWHYYKPDISISLPAAWRMATGEDVVVAVVDTGIRPHPDIASRLLPGHDFVSDLASANDGNARDADATDPGDWCMSDSLPSSSWHGLHVSGTIAAVTNNSLGVAGIAPNARILPVRVLGQCGGSNLDIADGMLWAAGISVPGVPDNPNPAKVINLSLGGFGPCGQRYADVIRQVRQRKVTVVVAAGNSDRDAAEFRPANCEGVISVAATNHVGARSYFGRAGAGSNFGATVKIAAPGGETHTTAANGILSTLNEGVRGPAADSYEAYQGTSMAAPHVAGIVALMYQVNPEIGPDEVLSILQRTSRPFPIASSRQCDTRTCGAGIADAAAAVSEAQRRRIAQAPSNTNRPATPRQ